MDRAAGARVLATASSDDVLAKVRQMAASNGNNCKTIPEWGDAVRQLTGGVGVDHVVEVGGASTLPQSPRALRTDGHVALSRS
jgi:NADPH:quinone reductase-like Zn-dependent oxidoreductase